MEFLISFFTDYGYWAVLFVLIICGFGVPIPEDITLVSGGVIAGLYPESVNSHLMLVVSMIGVLAGDSTMYWLGRIYGTRILRFRPMRKIVTLERLKMVREKILPQYGNPRFYLWLVSFLDYAHQFIWFQVSPAASVTLALYSLISALRLFPCQFGFTLVNLVRKT